MSGAIRADHAPTRSGSAYCISLASTYAEIVHKLAAGSRQMRIGPDMMTTPLIESPECGADVSVSAIVRDRRYSIVRHKSIARLLR